MICPSPASHSQPQSQWIATMVPVGSFSMSVGIFIFCASGPRGSIPSVRAWHDRPRMPDGRESFVGHVVDHKERRGRRWPLLVSRPCPATNSASNDQSGESSWRHLLREAEFGDGLHTLTVHCLG